MERVYFKCKLCVIPAMIIFESLFLGASDVNIGLGAVFAKQNLDFV